MKIEIIYNGNPQNDYEIYNLDENKPIRFKGRINNQYFDEDDLFRLLGEKKFTQFENDKFIFNIPNYRVEYVTIGICNPEYYNKMRSEFDGN